MSLTFVFSCEFYEISKDTFSYSAAKNYLLPQKFRSRHRRCSVKEGLLLERGSGIAKFLRTLILKNICKRLLLKISISVINLEAVVQRGSVKKVLSEISQNSQ